MMAHADHDINFADLPCPAPLIQGTKIQGTETKGRGRFMLALAFLVPFVVLGSCFQAHAIPGSTQNPDGSWTGPNGEDLGGGDPNYNPDPEPTPEPRQSHEGDPTGVLQCGCGYVVILRDGVSKAAAKRACEAAVPAKKECAK